MIIRHKELMIAQIFGTNNALLYPYIQVILEEGLGNKYFFMSNKEYQRLLINTPKNANRIYWIETLNRIQYGSIVNLLRSKKWIDALCSSVETNNLLSFCSSLRGLIEFAADSHYTFAAVPHHLAEEFQFIQSVFKSEKLELIQSKALEDALIHFSFAGSHRSKAENSKVYNAKQIRQYIEYSDDKNGSLYKFYKYLSGFVHPSTESIVSYLSFKNHQEGEYVKVQDSDEMKIKSIIEENKLILDSILCLSVYPSLFNLKMIAEFEIEQFKMKSILGLNYKQFKMWRDIKSRMEKASND
jgi:hypothetical protein